jgi:hypothetical protein
MKIKILNAAENDIEEGYRFYESQDPGLGSYFLDTLYSDIDPSPILEACTGWSWDITVCSRKDFPLPFTTALLSVKLSYLLFSIAVAARAGQEDDW